MQALRDWLCLAAIVVGLLPAAREATVMWRFAVGAPGERLHATAAAMPASQELVALPHRVVRPNTALWYASTQAFGDGATLEVQADDGAQVFVDGVRWIGEGATFRPPQGRVTPGRHDVVVRVLNNAVAGGLTAVSITRESSTRARPWSPSAMRIPAPESPESRRRLPGPEQPCDFTVWADSQGGWATFSALVARMRERPQHFSAGVGDLVDNGSDPEAWRAFVASIGPLARHTVVVPIAGNHDYDGFYDDLRARLYHEVVGRADAWVAWSCGPARFVALDLNQEFPIGIRAGSPQHRWLQREIGSAAWRDAVWRVLLVHQPPYSLTWEGYDGDDATRAIVRDLAARGLDLVVSGHSHAYEHLPRTVEGRRVHVLITGGAGGTLERPGRVATSDGDRIALQHHFVRARATQARLEVEAVGTDGQPFDRWAISPAPSSAWMTGKGCSLSSRGVRLSAAAGRASR